MCGRLPSSHFVASKNLDTVPGPLPDTNDANVRSFCP